jgi:diguanylate cyclase (GGDEF)-like protein
MPSSSASQPLLVVARSPERERLRGALAGTGRELVEADDVAAARAHAERVGFEVALVDLSLPDAKALVEELAGRHRIAVVPLAPEDPVTRVDRALESRRLELELADTRARLARAQRFGRLGTLEIDWCAARARLSEEARRILGFAEGELDVPLSRLERAVVAPRREAWRAWLADVAVGATDRPFEHAILRDDQTERAVRLHVERQAGPRAVRLHAIVHDVTDRSRVEEELAYQSMHDDLTGLANRRQLLEDLERAIDAAAREQRKVAVLFLDLDRFQDVNESLGHAAGDGLLVTVAERLRECVRERDSAARVDGPRAGDALARPGGDEFAVVLGGLRDRDEAATIAQRMLDVLARPFMVADREIYLTSCIGVALHPDDGSVPLELLKDAETALFHAKRLGCGSRSFYEASMDKLAGERLALQSALRRALERRDLQVWYQPRIELASARVVGMEALVRWHHPKLGFIPPAQFIPIAEESGLILSLGDFVLQEACEQMRRWHDAGHAGLRIAVNLSAEQFRDPGLPDSIERIAHAARLAPDSLELELTESILMHDVERALAVLRRLKGKGFHVSIDDFGTGYSSLSYLKRFPIDCLKIDCSFVRDVTSNTGDAAITAAILFMAHSLKLDVVAEGVETQEQLDFLRCHRCDQVQGFHFSPPLPAAAATELLHRHPVLPVEPLEPVDPGVPAS